MLDTEDATASFALVHSALTCGDVFTDKHQHLLLLKLAELLLSLVVDSFILEQTQFQETIQKMSENNSCTFINFEYQECWIS